MSKIKRIPNSLERNQFEGMKEKVLKINTDIDKYIYKEMIEHGKNYCTITDKRFTNFHSDFHNIFSFIPIKSYDDTLIYCELISPVRGDNENIVLDIHGAAFQKRASDVYLRIVDRFCNMLNQKVFMPDYRVGIDYTYDQMVNDVVSTYQYLVDTLQYSPKNITIVSDSSGTVTAMQMIRELAARDIEVPGKIILWSPIADVDGKDEEIEGHNDIAFKTNSLLSTSIKTYSYNMCKSKSEEEVYPLFGDYKKLKNSKLLIQAGGDEILLNDAYKLYDKFKDICDTTLEIYDEMFHNFQVYYSTCKMSKICWSKAIDFILGKED